MTTHNHNYLDRSTEVAYNKKGIGFSDCMNAIGRFFKLRSSRGYGSRKSAYSYYMRNM